MELASTWALVTATLLERLKRRAKAPHGQVQQAMALNQVPCDSMSLVAEQQAYTRGLRREVATMLPKVRAWSHMTRRGDIAELPGAGEQDPVWPWVTSTRENCLGAECPAFEDCFVLAARREAQAADIVVVNHYLLMADLVLKEEGFGELLPGADAIVIDEVDEPVFLGQTAGPDVRAEVPKGFRLPEPRERVGHDGLDKGDDFESHTSVVLDPVTKVFSELVLKDAVPTSRDCDGTPPWPGRTRG